MSSRRGIKPRIRQTLHKKSGGFFRSKKTTIRNKVIRDNMWQEALNFFTNACAYCGEAFSPTNPPTKDHIVPKSRGGATHITNLVPACSICNLYKGSKALIDFASPAVVSSIMEYVDKQFTVTKFEGTS